LNAEFSLLLKSVFTTGRYHSRDEALSALALLLKTMPQGAAARRDDQGGAADEAITMARRVTRSKC